MMESSVPGTVLIVDDQESNVLLLARILARAGYRDVHSTCDSRETILLYRNCRPDIILLDLQMPHLTGFEVMEQLRAVLPPDGVLPILVLTADASIETKQRALAGGAADFLTKPFDPIEVVLRIQNLLRLRFLHVEQENNNSTLEERVEDRTRALAAAQVQILQRLAMAAEFRDDETGEHAQRVGQVSALLAIEMGLPEAEVNVIRRSAPLHDVGKIAIPDRILLKPGKLTETEMRTMRSHTITGARLLAGSNHHLLKVAEEIALTHHERWDGTGYPLQRAGESIPLTGRIVGLADVYDALTHIRPYKQAWSDEDAAAEIEVQSGRQFDANVVSAFKRLRAKGALTPDGERRASDRFALSVEQTADAAALRDIYASGGTRTHSQAG
jgi:putative two-component system response regulator